MDIRCARIGYRYRYKTSDDTDEAALQDDRDRDGHFNDNLAEFLFGPITSSFRCS